MSRLADSRRRANSSGPSPCRIGRRSTALSKASAGTRWRRSMRSRRQRANQFMTSVVCVEQARSRRIRMFEFHPLDLGKTLRDFVAGNAHVVDVLAGLLDVSGELLHPLVETGEVLRQL